MRLTTTWQQEIGRTGGGNVYLSNPPGERIAKEGRKYGLHLLIASQRPREISRTIIAQLGTIISHALTHESDREIVANYGSYGDRTAIDSLSILPRRDAIVIGQAITLPMRVRISYLPADQRPESSDPLDSVISAMSAKPSSDENPDAGISEGGS